jgi:hypothetical protein
MFDVTPRDKRNSETFSACSAELQNVKVDDAPSVLTAELVWNRMKW